MGSTFYFYVLELGCFHCYSLEILNNEFMNLTHLHLQYNLLCPPVVYWEMLKNQLLGGKNSKHHNVDYKFY